ncbi:hypothetical protein [Herbaspirillum robiniae]|uniref:hypothetical protein n=1 Tax=Herbaspirillum robiniae TaxID=2014887 RepID=UPI003D77263F
MHSVQRLLHFCTRLCRLRSGYFRIPALSGLSVLQLLPAFFIDLPSSRPSSARGLHRVRLWCVFIFDHFVLHLVVRRCAHPQYSQIQVIVPAVQVSTCNKAAVALELSE